MLGAAADGSFLAAQLSPATDAFRRHLVARRCGFPTLNNLEFIMRGEGERSSPSMLSGLDFAPWREGIMLHTVELKGFIVLVLLRLCRFWMLDSRRRRRLELLQSGVWIMFRRFVQPDGKKYFQGLHYPRFDVPGVLAAQVRCGSR